MAEKQWSIVEARQGLSRLLKAARKHPQTICNRGQPVAAVVSAESFSEFERWKEASSRASIGESFALLRRICEEEAYVLEPPPRRDRATNWHEVLDE